ncbi:MAG: alpha/beta fold hydrolase [Gammaproteobacteria bacterium]|jgi:pimeloyl-ACP methyl ester carboxylesterase
MPHLSRDGVNIYYETHGSGPALILTHGFSATARMWDPQIEVLSRDHTLILWDMRGHGDSDAPEDDACYSEALTVDDMAALLDEAGADRAIVGGLSLGGYMSLAFHATHPERVRALLIIDCGPGYKKDAARDAWNRTAYQRAEDIAKHGVAALQGGSAERASAVHKDINGLVYAARNMLTQHNARVIESLPEIRVPSIVVAGAQDEPFLAATDYMAAKIPGAEKLIIADAGHAANMDQPDAFNRGILEFLARNKL